MVSGLRMDPRAAQTVKFLSLVVNLPPEDYHRVLTTYFNIIDERAELVAATWASFTGLLLTWLRWEDECRERKDECSLELPDEAKQVGVASYYSSSIKRLLVMAAEDMAVDWMLPGWLLWYSNRIGSPIAPKLRRLEPAELLARLTLFPLFVRGLRGASRALVARYEHGGSEYAHTTALFVYWDIVAALHEAVEASIHPVRRLYRRVLELTEDALYEYARLASVRAKSRRVNIREIAVQYSRDLSSNIGRMLVEKRIEVESGRL